MADTKLSALTELATTPASDDEVYIRDVSEAASAESKRITVTNLMAAATGTVIATGSYMGNATMNKAVAHGLGVTPKLVMIFGGTIEALRAIPGNPGTALYYVSSGYDAYVSVTAMDTTNFYVGDEDLEGNGNTITYYWVAIG